MLLDIEYSIYLEIILLKTEICTSPVSTSVVERLQYKSSKFQLRKVIYSLSKILSAFLMNSTYPGKLDIGQIFFIIVRSSREWPTGFG